MQARYNLDNHLPTFLVDVKPGLKKVACEALAQLIFHDAAKDLLARSSQYEQLSAYCKSNDIIMYYLNNKPGLLFPAELAAAAAGSDLLDLAAGALRECFLANVHVDMRKARALVAVFLIAGKQLLPTSGPTPNAAAFQPLALAAFEAARGAPTWRDRTACELCGFGLPMIGFLGQQVWQCLGYVRGMLCGMPRA